MLKILFLSLVAFSKSYETKLKIGATYCPQAISVAIDETMPASKVLLNYKTKNIALKKSECGESARYLWCQYEDLAHPYTTHRAFFEADVSGRRIDVLHVQFFNGEYDDNGYTCEFEFQGPLYFVKK